jgi:ABC-type branched-subunit amino acid transport system substrate-binding protein
MVVVGALVASIPASRATTTARAVPGVTSSTVTVAGLGYSAAYGDAPLGAQAVFDAVNRAGGVHGRQIRFAGSTDDLGSPAADAAAGRQLISSRAVLAVVPTVTPSFSAAPALARAHLPAFGWGLSTGFCNNPYGFAITGCIAAPGPVRAASSAWGQLIARFLRARGARGRRTTAAVIGEDDTVGRQGVQTVAASATAAGMTVVYRRAPLPPPPNVLVDDTSDAQAVLASNGGAAPDVVFLVVSFANANGLSSALTGAGFRGVITDATSYDAGLAGAAQGRAVLTQFAVPESAPTSPAMAKIVAQIRQSNGGAPVDQAALVGYFSADFFVDALRRAGRNPTPASLAQAAAHLRYSIRGVIGPTTYPAAQRYGTPCGSLVVSTGTAYQVAVPYSCFAKVDVRTLRPVGS